MEHCDILIIGSGAAGISAAKTVAQENANIWLVDAKKRWAVFCSNVSTMDFHMDSVARNMFKCYWRISRRMCIYFLILL